jgi:hypothetical protein
MIQTVIGEVIIDARGQISVVTRAEKAEKKRD